MHDDPTDVDGHAAHRDKLRYHIHDLHAHIQRLGSGLLSGRRRCSRPLVHLSSQTDPGAG